MVQIYDTVEQETFAFLKKAQKEQAWLTEYNFRRNFTSPFRIDEGMEEFASNLNAITNLVRQAKQTLSDVFDEFTVAEWIEQKLWPLLKDLQVKTHTMYIIENMSDQVLLHILHLSLGPKKQIDGGKESENMACTTFCTSEKFGNFWNIRRISSIQTFTVLREN